MLSDTVGFIRRLPHHLIASFRSTLEETVHCQLLLILIDASDPNAMSQLETVEETLKKIGANHQPRLLVVNKVDRFQDDSEKLIWVSRCPEAVQISAVTQDGIDVLTNEVHTIFIGPVKESQLAGWFWLAPMHDEYQGKLWIRDGITYDSGVTHLAEDLFAT